jgi:transcriptional regulator with XRE-family HTH domain
MPTEPSDAVKHIQTRSGASLDAPEYITKSSSTPPRPQALLRELRLKLGYGQRELAALAGLDQAQISRIEAGSDALYSTYEKFASALGGTLILQVGFTEPWPRLLEARVAARQKHWDQDWEERRRLRRERRA